MLIYFYLPTIEGGKNFFKMKLVTVLKVLKSLKFFTTH